MLRPARSLETAAALLAAVIVILGSACGGDDDGGAPSQPAASGPSSTGSTLLPERIDLGNGTGFTAYGGQDAADLLNVGATLALGDFNDDGNTDALIGAPQADGPEDDRADAGEAYVIFGPLDEDRPLGAGSADVTFFGAAAGDALGSTVLAGDVNNDGLDDVIIGAPGVTAGFDPRSDQGRVYAFFGDAGLGDEPERDLAEDIFDVAVTGAEGFSRLGHALDMGDVNGDGLQDMVIGAPFAGRLPGTPPGGERTALGEVYVIFGSEDLAGERNIARDEYDVLLSGGFPFGQFGASLGVGDVNGDGVDDIAVGAYRAAVDTEGTTSGAVYLFNGASNLSGRISVESGDQDATVVGPVSSSFGFPLVVADFNGDTVADIAAGAQLQTSGLLERQGAAHVIFGSGDIEGDLQAVDADAVTIIGGVSGELFPSALAAADIDGDGAADLVAGSVLAGPDGRLGAGIVHVFTDLGSAPSSIDLADETARLTVLGEDSDDRLGGAVAGGLLDDGTPGLLLLAAQAKPRDGDANTGVVYVVPVGQ